MKFFYISIVYIVLLIFCSWLIKWYKKKAEKRMEEERLKEIHKVTKRLQEEDPENAKHLFGKYLKAKKEKS